MGVELHPPNREPSSTGKFDGLGRGEAAPFGAPSVLVPRPAARYYAPRVMRTPGFIQPYQPVPADQPPAGPDWIHEIKHDGYSLMA